MCHVVQPKEKEIKKYSHKWKSPVESAVCWCQQTRSPTPWQVVGDSSADHILYLPRSDSLSVTFTSEIQPRHSQACAYFIVRGSMRRPRYFFCERAFPGKENYNVLLTTRPLSFWQSLKDLESQNIPSNYNCPLRLSAKTNVLQRTFVISAGSPPHLQPQAFLSTAIQSEYFWVHLMPGLAPSPRYCCLAPLWSESGLTWNMTLFSAVLKRVSPPQVRPLRAPEKHWRGRKRWKVKVLVAQFSSVAQSCPTLCDPMNCVGAQHARPPCPSPTPRVHPNSCP